MKLSGKIPVDGPSAKPEKGLNDHRIAKKFIARPMVRSKAGTGTADIIQLNIYL